MRLFRNRLNSKGVRGYGTGKSFEAREDFAPRVTRVPPIAPDYGKER